MKLPRLSIRWMMVAVAILALIAVEFRHGTPPRFVVRVIPARVARLKPGMNWQEAHDVLGLETSWLRGGTNARFFMGEGDGRSRVENYSVGPERSEIIPGREDGGTSSETRYLGSRAIIQLRFDTNPPTSLPVATNPMAILDAYKTDKSTRLTGATYSYDGKVVAEMPGGR